MTRIETLHRLLSGLCVFSLVGACKDAGGPAAGPPASMQIVSGQDQESPENAELANPLVVKVLDAAGKPVVGQLINFRVVAGGGSVFAGSSITNALGTAQERWTLGPATADSQGPGGR